MEILVGFMLLLILLKGVSEWLKWIVKTAVKEVLAEYYEENKEK